MGEYKDIPCKWCGDIRKWYVKTLKLAPETLECHNCWEIRRRAESDPVTAQAIIEHVVRSCGEEVE